MFEAQDDLAGVKPHLLLRKHPVLGEVIVHVTACNQRPGGQVTDAHREETEVTLRNTGAPPFGLNICL